MDNQKVIIIIFVVLLCIALMLMNLISYRDYDEKNVETSIYKQTSISFQKINSNRKDSSSPHAKTTTEGTIKADSNPQLLRRHQHHHRSIFHSVNESDLLKNHFGEGSFDHGETEALTKHEVQVFLLKYFGLLEQQTDSKTEDGQTEEDFFESDDEYEEQEQTNPNQQQERHQRQKRENDLNERFCSSRQKMVWNELKRFASPALLRALESQRKRHEAVANGTPFKNQKYLVWSLSGGLGNRFQSIVSCFVAAILSNRVFLMKDWFMPLPHSSVKQKPIIISSPNTDHYMLENLAKVLRVEDVGRARNQELLCPLLPMMSLREFVEKYPEEFFEKEDDKIKFKKSAGNGSNSDDHHHTNKIINEILAAKQTSSSSSSDFFFSHPQHVKVDIAHRHDKTLRRWNRMLCSNMSEEIQVKFDTQTHSDIFASHDAKKMMKSASSNQNNNNMAVEARFFFPEKFVYIWTNQYFLPGFFANPFTSKQMRALFPNNNPYSVLVRAIVMPSLPVVRQVRKFFQQNTDVSLLHPLEYVGLQIRAFRDREILELGKYFEYCFEKHHQHPHQKSPFFLATLHEAVRQHFAKKFGTGRVVTLAPARHEQKTGTAIFDQEALTDMFLLAFSKDLFVSPRSTFGSFVAAYAQTHPRIVSFDATTKMGATCSRAKFLEPCFASLIRYDKLMNGREGKLSCKLEKIPDGASGCDV